VNDFMTLSPKLVREFWKQVSKIHYTISRWYDLCPFLRVDTFRLKITAFFNMTPCSLVAAYRRFGGQILANNQFDALFHVFIYFISIHVSSNTAFIIRRSNLVCLVCVSDCLVCRSPSRLAVTYTD